jgi:6-methylpretetramide 4-monooxygenase / 4-hydroxy-6-methylpretetramide 12a-monooxygenase
MREERKEVLVVGAGPVGLWTALVLAESGVQTMIIDSENRTAARSYACALHPRTLSALDRFGIAKTLVDSGRRIEKFAFFEGETRQAEVRLKTAGGEFPFVLIVPQDVLERALEERLGKAGVEVKWNHRLDDFKKETESVAVSLEELKGTGTGYVVPHWETVVRRQVPIRAQFVVGADGHNSMTRQRLNISSRTFGRVEAFAAYEFESDGSVSDEVRVALDDRTTNVLWPLPGNRCRWTFQMVATDLAEFPAKERRAVHVANKVIDERVKEYVQRVAAKRAPWFSAAVKEVTWCTQVVFGQTLVDNFGQDRCWLAGDAAHQTGPVGVQSMNAGFAEGEMLAAALRGIIHDEGDMKLLSNYNNASLRRWKALLGPGQMVSEASAAPWVKERIDRIIPCLPGFDEDFFALASQLGLRQE